ncbi:MAG: four helix bundle protein [Desulfocapsa sp.]|nr:four helix bundle protein [Desulfocapsa sp.]
MFTLTTGHKYLSIGNRSFYEFINIAKGSAAELRTQVYIAGEIGVFSLDQKQSLVTEC